MKTKLWHNTIENWRRELRASSQSVDDEGRPPPMIDLLASVTKAFEMAIFDPTLTVGISWSVDDSGKERWLVLPLVQSIRIQINKELIGQPAGLLRSFAVRYEE